MTYDTSKQMANPSTATKAARTIQLDRSFYSIHREIYDWVEANTNNRWGKGYNILFGYQEIDLTPEQEKRFREFIDTLRG